MTHFVYRNGFLNAEQVPLSRIADEVGTPFYCYSTAALADNYDAFAGAFENQPATVCYALKANANLAVIRTLANLGVGADVVSGGELRRAQAAGIPGGKVVFSGVGKTREEMVLALEAGILQFNIESEPELATLNQVALNRGEQAPVALRVNPDVDAETHEKIATGTRDSKFGIDVSRAPAVYAKAAGLPGIAVQGIAVHIGSQLTDLAPFEAAFDRVAALVRFFRSRGLPVHRIDLGGGLGIRYADEEPPTASAYAEMVARIFTDLDVEFVFEPGRVLVGDAGVLVTTVLYVKETYARTFVVVDAAMNDLLRPSLYGANHPINAVAMAAKDAPHKEVDVVGPVCETGDVFAKARALSPLASGDLVAIGAVGAYGAVMSSAYNTRPPAAEVLVRGSAHAVVRARSTIDELMAQDLLPSWLAASEARGGGAA